jgi:hypothetical protein
MLPAVDRSAIEAMVDGTADILEQSGVLDLPPKVNELVTDNRRLTDENRQLTVKVQLLEKAVERLEKNPPVQMNMDTDHLADQIGKAMSWATGLAIKKALKNVKLNIDMAPVAKSISEGLAQNVEPVVVKPVVYVDTATMATGIAKSLTESFAPIFKAMPGPVDLTSVLESISEQGRLIEKSLERPQPLPNPIINDNAAVAKAMAEMAEHMRVQAEQSTEAIRQVRKALERMEKNEERQQAIQKSLVEKLSEQPAPPPARKVTKTFTQQYDGSVVCEEVDATE